MDGAVSEVQIDEILVGHAEFSCEPLEIGHRPFVQTNGDGLFKSAAIGVPLPLHPGKIILCSHEVTSRNAGLPAESLFSPK